MLFFKQMKIYLYFFINYVHNDYNWLIQSTHRKLAKKT